MSSSYTTIKTAMDLVFKNNPLVKIRGIILNNFITHALQLSRDRIGNVTFDQTGLADECLIYYDSGTSTYKVRKIQWHTVADITEYDALVFDTDYFAMDYIVITENGAGYTEIRRYIDGAVRKLSEYQNVTDD